MLPNALDCLMLPPKFGPMHEAYERLSTIASNYQELLIILDNEAALTAGIAKSWCQ